MKIATLCVALLALLFLTALGWKVPTIKGVVSTITGSGRPGYADGKGKAAQFDHPEGVACDGSGNVFVTDFYNQRIRKIVAVTGVVSTLAGSGVSGFANGAGNAAEFYGPTGVACDGSGNLFVADFNSNRIRKIVVATGVVSTLAGSGVAGYADGTGTAAQFDHPVGMACDGNGNVYVADSENNRIRKIVAATGMVSALAGSGVYCDDDGAAMTAQFARPKNVAYDGSGNLFVADANYARIRKIGLATGMVSTLAGSGKQGYVDGTSTSACFKHLKGIACDGSGNVFVTDADRIRKIVAATGVVSTVAGSGNAGYANGRGIAASFCRAYGIACDGNGKVYVADQGNHCIRVIK